MSCNGQFADVTDVKQEILKDKFGKNTQMETGGKAGEYACLTTALQPEGGTNE
tara:strand:- start:8552 stop:8710 length:159 start_codon:yes stop_codon:yes gene_type:complete